MRSRGRMGRRRNLPVSNQFFNSQTCAINANHRRPSSRHKNNRSFLVLHILICTRMRKKRGCIVSEQSPDTNTENGYCTCTYLEIPPVPKFFVIRQGQVWERRAITEPYLAIGPYLVKGWNIPDFINCQLRHWGPLGTCLDLRGPCRKKKYKDSTVGYSCPSRESSLELCT